VGYVPDSVRGGLYAAREIDIGVVMRNSISVLLSILACGCATAVMGAPDQYSNSSSIPRGELQIEIQSPSGDLILIDGETTIELEGVASTIGGVRYLDMMLVMDTSSSLRGTDPKEFRLSGAIGLIKNLSPKSDTKIGVVFFDDEAELAQPMTSDRDKVVRALTRASKAGRTNLAAGIRTALKELEKNGRPDSSRVIMLFTDGKSNRRQALAATQEALYQGVTIQTLLLGSSEKGASILDEVAQGSGGTFVQVTDPTLLPDAFLNLRTTGVDSVTLSVNGSHPILTRLTGGTFTGSVPLEAGDNHIVALATSLDERTQVSEITVTVRDASCAALEVTAMSQGRPVLSLNDRAVEIVVDASRSMWGRMDDEPKMVVAKNILMDVSDWVPEDLDLALRAYGSTSPSDDGNCHDSTLLVPFGDDNRWAIRDAIDGLRPLGQTPIAFALNEAANDFGTQQDDRVLVLVTDGIESCGGDPVQAARELREQGITVHLVGFGLGNAKDEDAASLQAVADASGGRYVTAGSAEELKDALAQTVGTSFRVFKGNTVVAVGSLGSDKPLYLPGGDYRVELDTSPLRVMQIDLTPGDQLTLTLEKRGDYVSHFESSDPVQYRSCEDAIAAMEYLEPSEKTQDQAQTSIF